MHPAYSEPVARIIAQQTTSTSLCITQRLSCLSFRGLGAGLLLAVAAIPGAHAQAVAPAQGTTAASKPGQDVQKLSQFVVTEEKAYTDRNVDIPRTVVDIQAYNIISRESLDAVNPVDMNSYLKEELLQSTANSENAQVQPQAGSVDGTRNSGASLRGLGATGTLVLVNGRRTAPYLNGSTMGQADLNTIPMASVEKIVVLSGSGSAIYGGEAAGGVINVITKKNYQGGELSLSYGDVFKGYSPQRSADLTYGFTINRKTHVLLSASYSDRIPLLVKDRPYIKKYEQQSMRNAPNGSLSATASRWNVSAPFPGDTPNISLNPATVNGYVNPSTASLILKNGTSLNATMTFVPKNTAPANDISSAFVTNAGKINFNLPDTIFRGGLRAPLGAHPITHAYRAAIDHELTSRLSLFFEAGDSLSIADNYSDPFTNPYVVPGNSPANPFRQNVFISFPRTTRVPNYSSSESRNISVGLVANWRNDWRGVATYTWSEGVVTQEGMVADTTALTNNLNSGALNPFVDTLAFPLDLPSNMGMRTYKGSTTINTVDLHASGQVPFFFSLKPKLTFGAEHRKEGRAPNLTRRVWVSAANRKLDDDVVNFGQAKSIDALFAETTVALVTPEKSRPLLRGFELQLALRLERANTGISTNRATFFPNDPARAPAYTGPIDYHVEKKQTLHTDMIGFKYQPIRSVSIRGSVAGALISPSLSQLTGGAGPVTAAILDPKLGTSYIVTENIGGNPNLKSTESLSRTIGVIWEPSESFLKGFRFNFERWDIEQKNIVTTLSALNMLDAEGSPAAEGRIIRDATTRMITFLDLSAINFAKGISSGYDVSGAYRRKTPIGSFQFKAAMVRTLTFVQSNNQGVLRSYLGFVNRGGFPIRHKANGSIGWRNKSWAATWNTTYYGPYTENGAPGDPGGANDAYAALGRTNVRSQITHKISTSYAFPRRTDRRWLLADMTVTVGINNIFDAEPAADTFFSTFISSTFLPKYGREWWLRLNKSF